MAKSVREPLVPFGDISSPNGDRQESEQKFSAFGERLRQAASEDGTTQSRLAQDLGLTRGTFTRYWNGERLPPSDVLIDLAEALNVSARWLIRGGTSREDVAARSVENSDWVNVPEYDLRQLDDHGKGDPISSITIRRDWLYLTLGDASGLWIARTLAADPVRGLNAGAPIVCKDHPIGDAPVEGQHYIFRVNGGIVMARFSFRGAAQIGDRLGEAVVSPIDLEPGDNQHFIIARVLGALARPL